MIRPAGGVMCKISTCSKIDYICILFVSYICNPLRSSTSGLTPGQTCLPMVVSRCSKIEIDFRENS